MERRRRRERGESPASFRVRTYLLLRRWLNHFFSVMQGIRAGLWLGLLDREALQDLTRLHYSQSDRRYHRPAFNLSGFKPWEAAAFATHFDGCRSVLVGGAGGGREAVAVSRRCSRVDAFECNPRLVDRCKALIESQGVGARIIRAAPDEVPDGLGTYDGAILGWGAYIHIVGRERRIRLLRQFHRHLEPGGPLLLSFFARGDSVSQRLTYRIAKVLRTIRGAAPAEPGESLTTRYEYRFTEEEIREELAEGGFEMVLYSEEGDPHAVGRALPAAGRNVAALAENARPGPDVADESGQAIAGHRETEPSDEEQNPPLRIKAYLFVRRWLTRFLKVPEAAHVGFWLGTFDRAHLQELTELHYASADKRYYRPAYNLSGLEPWEAAALDAHFGDCQSVLVGSAGGGREVLAVSRRCSKVDAFECSPHLVEQCKTFLRAKDVTARIFAAAPDEVPDGLGTYDGAILGWTAYFHIVGRWRRVRMLEQLRRHLRDGGPLLLSFHTRTNSVYDRLSDRIAALVRRVRRAAPAEPGDWITTWYGHYFTEQEIRDELADGGFELVLFSEEGCPHAVGRALPAEDH